MQGSSLNRHAIVTGSYGFLGRHVVRALHADGWSVTGVGRNGPLGTMPSAMKPDLEIEGAIHTSSLEAALSRGPKLPDAVIHAAGSGSVQRSQIQTTEDFERSIASLSHTLEFMRAHCPSAMLVFPSSAAVYGQTDATELKEDLPLAPISIYGLHKQLCEGLIQGYSRQFGIKSRIIRFFSIYGPGLRKQLIWDICEKARLSKRITLSGDGTERRDFIHVEDAARLILYVIKFAQPDIFVLNGGTGLQHSVRDVAEQIACLYGVSPPQFDAVARSFDPSSYCANVDRAREVGFQEQYKLQDGLRDVVNWHKQNYISDIHNESLW